ncbi:hypothetical protein [Mycolicibacterium sp. CBMA 234]|uniref:hypothetical protein n=1 Tax=Mycolicibacterium sp. CBMA 234 TaxID=1918495 RepID=UPI0012DF71CC|nr:hypothetical protein [Mycolicibacterium sp. CBMA 234]
MGSLAIALFTGRSTYGFGGDARNRVTMALISMGIGLVGLLLIVLIVWLRT